MYQAGSSRRLAATAPLTLPNLHFSCADLLILVLLNLLYTSDSQSEYPVHWHSSIQRGNRWINDQGSGERVLRDDSSLA